MSTTRRRMMPVLGILVATTLLSACDEHLTSGAMVKNSTTTPLSLHYVRDDGREIDLYVTVPVGDTARALGAGPLAPSGIGAVGSYGCTTGTLIALDPAGREVARHGPGLCVDQTWDIRAGPKQSGV